MGEEGSFKDMVVEDAKARIAIIEGSTSQEVREWKLETALQKLASDRKKCPKDLHDWIPTGGSCECSDCEKSSFSKAYCTPNCWQKWALQQVEQYISDSYEIINEYAE